MKKFKSMVAIITVLCLCTCYIPNAVLTETNMISVNAEDVVTSGKCGENVTWNFDETTGILTIDGTGEMQDFNFYDDVSWKYLRENIKTVIINDGVTSIGNYAFLECSSLESISIPESVIEIGLSAFENCSALQFITIPDSVKEINGSAFENCSALQSIIIPDGVEKIEGGTFEYCSALESIQIPDSVTEIGRDAFAFCLSLESVTISENITEIGSYAFYNSSLQSFIVSENNPNYSSQDGVLFDKNKTTLEIFPARNTMTEYTIPDSVTEISQFAFNNCSVLESLMISDNLKYIWQYTFMNCTALQAINVSENNDYYSSQDGILFNKNKSVLIVFPARNAITEYTIPDSVKSVYDYAFTDCSNLQSVIISENMVEIELGAFYNCTALESVTISDSITTIGYNAFENCTALASITIPETVTTIENDAFKDCSALQSVMIPESVTELGYGAFDECSNLESITILNPICDFVERELLIGGPASPVEDTIPSTTVIYGYEFSTAKAYAEENGNEFISLGEKEIIGELGTNLTWTFDTATGTLTISGTGGMKNFYDTANSPTWSYLSENIKKVVIEDGVTSIGDEAFFGYSSLESVSIPDSLTSIGKYAFGYCTSLESVILPESVEYIGYHAFCDCSGLEAITIKNPDCEIYDGILGYCTISEAAVIYGYENSTAQAYAEKYDRNFISLTEMLTGDANGDGEFNILDIITLQKWLLGTGDLPNWQAVDFNQDGIINIFDLVLAKKYYLNI